MQRIRGITGGALGFDGKRQYAEIPVSSAGLNVGEEDFTLECWIRTSDSTHTRNIIDKRDAVPRGYLLYIRRGRIGFQAAGASRSDAVAEMRNVADGRWHHVAARCRRLPPEPLAIYVDGMLASSRGRVAPLDDLDNKTPMWLGRHHANEVVPREDVFFEGAIDELAVYRRALTPAEILALYRAGSAGKCHSSR